LQGANVIKLFTTVKHNSRVYQNDVPSCGITYDKHSDDSKGTYDCHSDN
jgi:hypothetical protein